MSGAWDPLDHWSCWASLSVGFSRQECWSGLHFPLQGIVLTQRSNRVSCVSCVGRRVLPHCTTGSACLSLPSSTSMTHLISHLRGCGGSLRLPSSLTWEAAAAPSGCPHLSPERLRRLPQAALPLSLPPLLPSFILKAGARVSLKSGSEHVTPQILIAQRPQSVGSLGLQWLALSVMFLTSFSTSLPPALLASHTGFSDAPQTRQNYTSGCLC